MGVVLLPKALLIAPIPISYKFNVLFIFSGVLLNVDFI
jgi:hypothetical protein